MLEKGVCVKYNDDVLRLIAEESFSEKYGARNMRRYIEKNVEDKLAEILISVYPERVTGISITVASGKLQFDHI